MDDAKPKAAKNGKKGTLDWVFDLDGIKDMYSSCKTANYGRCSAAPGLRWISLAERSAFVWAERRKQIIKHWCKNSLLENSSHWVPSTIQIVVQIMKPSFEWIQ